jgi:flavin reductase (DIM6/NTAB) family NADH-FMN oxidoreductase RutF
LSEAVAETVTVPLRLAPPIGAVRETVGAVVSPFDTVTLTPPLVVVLPAASRATAVSVWEPSATVVVLQERL